MNHKNASKTFYKYLSTVLCIYFQNMNSVFEIGIVNIYKVKQFLNGYVTYCTFTGIPEMSLFEF